MEKATDPAFALLEQADEESEIVYQTEAVSQIRTVVSTGDNVQTMYALTPATIQDESGGLRQVYVTLDNPDALGSLAEINSSQLVTLHMQVPPSQLNLPGGQVLLHQQEGVTGAGLSDQVSVAFVDPEKDVPMIEKPTPVFPTEVFSQTRATLSDNLLDWITCSKELMIQELSKECSLDLEDEDSLVTLVGSLKQLLKAEYRLLQHLPIECQSIIKANCKDASCQTDGTSTESRSVECSILRPQFSRAGREVKKKYFDLPEDYRMFDVKSSSDKPMSRLIKKTTRKNNRPKKISQKIMEEQHAIQSESPTKETETFTERNDLPCNIPENLEETISMPVSTAIEEPVDPIEDEPASLLESEEKIQGGGEIGEGETEDPTDEPTDMPVTVTGEVVEDELQRAMVEGFLTMYTMKSNGEMLVPAGDRDIDLLPESNTAPEENSAPPTKKKKDYEKLAPFKYFCQKCSFKTKRESHFLKHVKLHSKYTVYRCDKCDFATLTFTHLRKHEVVHSSKLFQCNLCPYNTVTSKLLARHQRNKHSEKAASNKKAPNKVYQCSHCDYHTTLPLRFTRHIRRHTAVTDAGTELLTTVYKCDKCPYNTHRKEHFRRHVDNVHSNKRPHLCDFCGKSFNRTDNLQTHKQTHMDKSHRAYPFYCNICDRTFRTKGHLKEHAVKHSTERQYLCEICGASFKTRAVQRKHVQTIHLNAGAFPCTQCSKVFSTKHAMKRHMKTHDTPGMRALHNTMTEVITDGAQVIQGLGDLAGQTVTVITPGPEHIEHITADAIEANSKIESFEQSETFEQAAEGATSYVTQSADGTTTLLYLAPIQ